MGAMPHAAGKGSDEERTKKSPDYLRRQYAELAELPKAMPGVIGANPDADEQSPPARPAPPAAVTGTDPPD
jgi:hypothetical protein